MGKRKRGLSRREMWDLWCTQIHNNHMIEEVLKDALIKLEKAKREIALWHRNAENANARHDRLKKAHARQVEMISALYRVAVVAIAMPYHSTKEPSSYSLVTNDDLLALRKMAEHAIKMVDIGQGHDIERAGRQ